MESTGSLAGAVIVLLAAFTLSGSWYYGYTKLVYDPVISYAGQETTFTGIVTHQTIFNNDKASYQVKGTFPDGTSATILCYTNDYGCNYGDIPNPIRYDGNSQFQLFI